MKIGIIVGSTREGSYNKKLARVFEGIGQEKNLEMNLLEIEKLPMFSQDIEKDKIESVNNLREGVSSSDAIIIITPEHNLSIPAVLKNALDWLSRVENPMIGKAGMIAGASMGFLGTVNAQNHLREILESPGLGLITMPGNKIYIGEAQRKFDSEGKLSDENTKKFIESVFDEFIQWIEKIK